MGEAERQTLDVYEERAGEWLEKRAPESTEVVTAFAREVAHRPGPSPGLVLDAGCGPGWFTGELPSPTVALDAAAAMLELVPRFDPGALRVRADIESLPFRRGAFRAAWATKSYVHTRRSSVPLALADLHRAVTVGAAAHIEVFSGDLELGPFPDDHFGGRQFSAWSLDQFSDVLVGAGFEVERIEQDEGERRGSIRAWVRRARTLADTVGADMAVLVCGLNPSVNAADAGVGFARPGNRFWPAALASGLATVDRDPHHALLNHGTGMTDLVKRATARADGLTAAEYRDGMGRLERLAGWLQPGVVCFVGLAGWRAAVDRAAVPGTQPSTLGGRPVYVSPSTSGANASSRLADLAAHLAAARALAG